LQVILKDVSATCVLRLFPFELHQHLPLLTEVVGPRCMRCFSGLVSAGL